MGVSNSTVVYLNANDGSVHYYARNDQNHIIHDIRKIVAIPFSEEYYKKLVELLKDFASKYTPSTAANTSIVLSDSCVFNNTTTFPTLPPTEFAKTIEAYLLSTYPNFRNTKIKQTKALSTKASTIMSFTGITTSLLKGIQEACTEAKFIAKNITYASCASIAGLATLNAKTKNASYILLDIKEHECKYIVVHKGNVIGSMDLPIGYENLAKDAVLNEDVLLYTPEAELLVVNAREKAKQKTLTATTHTAEETEPERNDESDEFGSTDDEFNAFAGTDALVEERAPLQAVTIKSLPKKVARKLPKFMQREMPEGEDAQVNEKFRVFIKWALDIIKQNKKFVGLGSFEKIYVNMPKEYSFLFDLINTDENENGIKFMNAGLGKEKDDITRNLEMFGAFFIKSFKQSTLF